MAAVLGRVTGVVERAGPGRDQTKRQTREADAHRDVVVTECSRGPGGGDHEPALDSLRRPGDDKRGSHATAARKQRVASGRLRAPTGMPGRWRPLVSGLPPAGQRAAEPRLGDVIDRDATFAA